MDDKLNADLIKEFVNESALDLVRMPIGKVLIKKALVFRSEKGKKEVLENRKAIIEAELIEIDNKLKGG